MLIFINEEIVNKDIFDKKNQTFYRILKRYTAGIRGSQLSRYIIYMCQVPVPDILKSLY